MITLTIRESDGSMYWAPVYFDTQKECDEWIKQEEQRPYWVKSRTYERVVSEEPPEIDPKVKKEREGLRAEAAKYLSEFDAEKYDPVEIGEIIDAILIVQGLK